MDAIEITSEERAIGFEPTTSSLGSLITASENESNQTHKASYRNANLVANREEVISLYESGQSSVSIGRKLGVHCTIVIAFLRRNGVVIRSWTEAGFLSHATGRYPDSRQFNESEFRDGHVVLFAKFEGSRAEILVDRDDFDRLQAHGYGIRIERRTHSVYGRLLVGGKNVYLHQFITGSRGKVFVADHRDGNGLDNRRKNLRVVDRTMNSLNRVVQRQSISGLRGVYWVERKRKFVAQITVRRKLVWLGSFKDKHAAAAAVAAKLFELGVNGEAARC